MLPVSHAARDWYNGQTLYMTPVDTLDTLLIMGMKSEADKTREEIVKNLTGASLMDAKKLVEGVPAKIKEKVSKEDAEKVKAELTAAGATVEVK